MPTLNEVLHRLAHISGANDSHDIHGEIDEAVPQEKGEEEPPDAEK